MAKMDSPCLFCGGLPCECDGGQTRKSSPRTRKASSPREKKITEKSPDSTPSVSATEASTEDVFGDVPTATSKFKSKSVSVSDRDLSLESALRALLDADILSSQDRTQISRELRRPYPHDIDRRVHEWKAKRHA